MAENQYNSKVVLASGEVLMDLTPDTVDPAHVLNGYTFHDKAGAPQTGSCTFDSDTSEDTAAVGEILEGKTAHARGSKLTGTMPNNGAQNGEITTKDGTVTIKQGYHDGSGSVAIADAEKARQEARPLLAVKDFFQRVIISKSMMKPWTDETGIKHIGLYDFLLNEFSLTE